MQADIHPNYSTINVSCAGCDTQFETRSTMNKDELRVDLCSGCHPFFTGTQKIVDSAGRVERFAKKYGNMDYTKLSRR